MTLPNNDPRPMAYSEQVYVRPKNPETGFEIDQYDWVWRKTDTGAWDGPRTDWEHHHKTNYFMKVRKYDVAVQAGGCHGVYPKLLANRFKHVYTFEPDPLSFYCLVNNCAELNVSAFNAGLGETCRTVRVNVGDGVNVGMHTIAPDDGCWTLELTIDSLGLRECDLICLDIEGYELRALRGAEYTIGRFRPVIVVENANEDIKHWLVDRRYQFLTTSVSDTVFIPI